MQQKISASNRYCYGNHGFTSQVTFTRSVCCVIQTFLALAVAGGSFSPLFFRFFSACLLPRRAVVSVMLVGVCWNAVYNSSGTSSPLSVALVSPSATIHTLQLVHWIYHFNHHSTIDLSLKHKYKVTVVWTDNTVLKVHYDIDSSCSCNAQASPAGGSIGRELRYFQS